MYYISALIFSIFILEPAFSQESERVYKDNILTEVNSFYPSDLDLFRPNVFSTNESNNSVIIYDYSQSNLYKVQNQEITTKIELGKGRGSGPQEFRNPTDMCITDNSLEPKIVIIDLELSRVSLWDLNTNKFIRSFSSQGFVPFRVACSYDKIILFNSSGSKEGNFLVYDFMGNQEKGIDDSELSKDGFLDSGFITADSTYVYFVSEGKPNLKKYNYRNITSGLSKSIVKSHVNENDINRRRDGDTEMVSRKENFRYYSRDVDTWKNYLVVFYSGRTDAFGNVIDFYEKGSLEYKFSTKIEQLFTKIEISGDYLLLNVYDFERKERKFTKFKISVQ